MSKNYLIGYKIVSEENLPVDHYAFSLDPPPKNDTIFTCSVFDSSGNLIQSLHSGKRKKSKPIRIAQVPGDELLAHFNYEGSGMPDIITSIKLSGEGGLASLNQNNISFKLYKTRQHRKRMKPDGKVSTPAPLSYNTGFDDTGVYYFLSYIPWIKQHFVQAYPPVQNSQYYLSGHYSCEFGEGITGDTYIDTNDLPIPPGSAVFTISYGYRLISGQQGSLLNILQLDVYEDGTLKKSYYSSFTGINENGWYLSTFKHTLSPGSTTCSIVLSLEPSGRLGAVLVVDNLSLNFLSAPVDTSVSLLVYADSDGNIYGLNRSTGQQVWKYSSQGELLADSILISDEVVYFGDGGNSSNVYALNIQNGSLIWKSQNLNGEIASAAVATSNSIIIGCSNGYMYALDKNSGAIDWSHSFYNSVSRQVSTGNVYIDVNGMTPDNHGLVYLATDDGVYSINELTEQSIWYYSTSYGVEFSVLLTEDSVVFADRGGNIICLDKSTGTLIWKNPWQYPINSQFYLAGGIAIFGDDGGNLTGINVANGSKVWTLNFPGAMIRSFTLDGSSIYVGANTLPGLCFCYSYTIDNNGVWSFSKLWQGILPVGAQCPSVTDAANVYFTGTDQSLYAFNKFTGTSAWTFGSGTIGFASPAIDYPSPIPALTRRYDQCCFLVAHNAYANVDDGWWFAQQTHNIIEQLNMGARGLELDIFLQTINGQQQIVYNHEGAANWLMFYKASWKLLSDSLNEIKNWLDNNPNEIITIIFEQGPGLANPDPRLSNAFSVSGISNYVFYANQVNQGINSTWNVATQGWPTLQWLVDNGKRLVVFSQKSKGNTTGFANLWDYAVENNYGILSLFPGCSNREESNPLSQNTGKLFVVNYALNLPVLPATWIPASYYTGVNNYYDMMIKLWCCKYASGNNRLPNLLKVNFFEFGAIGGPLEIVKQINNQLAP